jgi:hypothetical protein
MDAITGFFLVVLSCKGLVCQPVDVLPPFYTYEDCEKQALAMAALDPRLKAYRCDEKPLVRS